MVGLWIGFIVLVLVLLALDLGVFHRKEHAIGWREALGWSAFWIALALVFNVVIYFAYRDHWLGLGENAPSMTGGTAAVLFFTGYVVEKSLSMDNLFLIALIFSYFGVPPRYQHRVLFWGILGALILRGIMIGLGAALIQQFEWILYVFGAFLLISALRMLLVDAEPDPRNNRVVRLARRWFPITPDFVHNRLLVRQEGRRMLTPLALALIVVESTDVMFAVDSIPAIFAITTDPFLVFTSNVFAILGLRSLYFALASVMDKFYYLKMSLIVLLALIGVKLLLKDHLHAVPGLTYYTLGSIALILGTGVAASVVRARRLARAAPIEQEAASS